AEDGIRDFHVTGVQTCALPILVGRTLVADQCHATAEPHVPGGPRRRGDDQARVPVARESPGGHRRLRGCLVAGLVGEVAPLAPVHLAHLSPRPDQDSSGPVVSPVILPCVRSLPYISPTSP